MKIELNPRENYINLTVLVTSQSKSLPVMYTYKIYFCKFVNVISSEWYFVKLRPIFLGIAIKQSFHKYLTLSRLKSLVVARCNWL